MLLIIGGAYQGKEDFVRENFAPAGTWLDGADFDPEHPEKIQEAEVITSFHLLLANVLKAGKDPEEVMKLLLENADNKIIITNELGYGVVPMEAFDRRWRELTGRCCTRLAAHSEHVYRVICGIGTCMK